MGVPEVVKADVRYAGPVEYPAKCMLHRARVQRAAVEAGEDDDD